MKVRDVEMISPEAPTQFQGRTSDDDRPVYVRYRHGGLSVEVGKPGEAAYALPSGGFEVFSANVDVGDTITWSEVERLLAPLDLEAALGRLERQEQAYLEAWSVLLRDLRVRDVAGIPYSTILVKEDTWTTPYCDRVGRFDFERVMREHAGGGVCAYAFFNDHGRGTITVLVSDEWLETIDARDLATRGAEAFGGVRFGVSGGRRRGNAEGQTGGDADRALELVATRIAELAAPAR